MPNMPPTLDLTEIDPAMIAAARLKVLGMTWENIGAEVNRAAETVRQWPVKRASQWSVALRQAIDENLPQMESEALTVLRVGLRSHNEATSQNAADRILGHCGRIRKHETTVTLRGELEHTHKLSVQDRIDAIAKGLFERYGVLPVNRIDDSEEGEGNAEDG